MFNVAKPSRRSILVMLAIGLAGCADIGVEPPKPAVEAFLIFFPFDSADIDQAAQQNISVAVAKVPSVKPTRIQVSGYADITGGTGYNRALAERRAGGGRAADRCRRVGRADQHDRRRRGGHRARPQRGAPG